MIPYAPTLLGRLHFSHVRSRTRVSRLLTLLLILASAERSYASDPRTLGEYQIKAGFVLNFTRFVEWPENAFATTASPITVCIAGETPLADLLPDVVVGKVVDGRAVSVKRVRVADDLRRCNLLFISASEQRRTTEILGGLKKASTLTVGETPGFAQGGGMINFAIQDNKVKLEMNLDAATQAGLKLNSKLIAVSRLVSYSTVAEAK